MKLLTKELTERLLRNGANRGQDHAPVVKFFNPTGGATWLITEMDPEDCDTLFGLCDLGQGFPELGSVSLAELSGIKVRFGLGIERDLHFTGKYPISVYAKAADIAGGIVESDSALTLAQNMSPV
jgi:hypothetical protein